MPIEIRTDHDLRFQSYASISVAFEVRERVNLAELAIGAAVIPTRRVPVPWTKNYDDLPANAPTEWPTRFDVHEWRIIGAYIGEGRVGAAVVALSDSAVAAIGGRPGCALLWDLRVAPKARGRGRVSQCARRSKAHVDEIVERVLTLSG